MPNHVISEQLKILDSLEVNAFRTRSDEVQLNDVFVCRQGLSLMGMILLSMLLSGELVLLLVIGR
ncbi:hypothetical protein JCM19052_484 [Vibrio sp. JCM 19052]|nr:hypothetical protein JCM19052_484 [Vibrio sp. JCM 19052]